MMGRLCGSTTLLIMTSIITPPFIMALIILSISIPSLIMLSVTNKTNMLSAFLPGKVNYISSLLLTKCQVDKMSS